MLARVPETASTDVKLGQAEHSGHANSSDATAAAKGSLGGLAADKQ